MKVKTRPNKQKLPTEVLCNLPKSVLYFCEYWNTKQIMKIQQNNLYYCMFIFSQLNCEFVLTVLVSLSFENPIKFDYR